MLQIVEYISTFYTSKQGRQAVLAPFNYPVANNTAISEN